MNDEKNKNLSDSEQQPSTKERHRVEPGQVSSQRTHDEEDKTTSENERPPSAVGAVGGDSGVLLRDRPPRPGTIEVMGSG